MKINKSIFSFIFSALVFVMVIFCFDSCFNQEKPTTKCDDINYKDGLEFFGYAETELDTIKIISFQKNSNYKTVIDSFLLFPEKIIKYPLENYISINIQKKPLNTSFDYEVICNSDSFQLSEIKIDWDEHRSQFSSDYECEIASYKVNGKYVSSGNIKLDKINTTAH